ncbi:MAG: cytochrome c biogenesis protein ResB [Alloprevotella sp.]|nr:cytochrome c biogenesis protein ResB [Alloprevotella sp.]
MKARTATYVIALVILQLIFGNLEPKMFAFPINFALLASLIAICAVVEREYGKTQWIKALRSTDLSIISLCLIAVWCVAGGCVPQTDAVSSGWLYRTGLTQFATSLPFVGLLSLLLVQLTLIIIHRLRRPARQWGVTFIAAHAGLWLALAAGLMGSADMKDLRCIAMRGQETRTAYDKKGRIHALPYAVELKDFHVERSEADHSVVQYEAAIALDGERISISVNNPHAATWQDKLYLVSYDHNAPDDGTAYCVLQIVRQPWQAPMCLGITLLLCGVGGMLLSKIQAKQ